MTSTATPTDSGQGVAVTAIAPKSPRLAALLHEHQDEIMIAWAVMSQLRIPASFRHQFQRVAVGDNAFQRVLGIRRRINSASSGQLQAWANGYRNHA